MATLSGQFPASTFGDLLQAANTNGGVTTSLRQMQDGLGNGTGLYLSQSQIGVAGTDIGLKRVAAKVAGVTDGSTNLGWMQTVGSAALASDFTRALATMASTNLSFAVLAGRSYLINGLLQVSDSVAGEGGQFDFNGGSATATTFFMTALRSGSTFNAVTALATAIAYTTLTGTNYVTLSGYLKVNAGGTFILRAAQNSHSSGTFTLGAGSWLSLTDMVTL